MVHNVVFRATKRRVVIGICALAIALIATGLMRAQSGPSAPASPGAQGDGTTLLPNGWRIAPVGRHLPLSTLPLNMALSPDGRYVVVSNNGLARPTLSVIDISSWTVKHTVAVDAAWLGIAFSPDGTSVYSSSANQNAVQEYAFADGVLTRARTFTLPAEVGDTFAGGLAISPDGRTLYVTRVFAMTLSAINLSTGQVAQTAKLGAEPYTCVVSRDGRFVYVSIWGGAAVDVFAADSLRFLAEWPTGEHPSAMTVSNDDQRLFVACASSSSVWVFDTFSGDPIEQISTNLYPAAPPTATPNSVALSADGRTLLVANADNNAVAVIDVGNAARSFVDGFIPAGWYPTAAMFSRDGKQILILSGRGFASAPNPNNASMDRRIAGAISIVATPDRTTLNEYQRRVLSLTPYSDVIHASPNVPIGSPIPRTVGATSPIKHVFYVIRENRTYDQILGDLREGNGDPRLAIFGRDITPNAHAIAQSFVVFDNFYVDADVSANGHAFSTAAYSTDFIEKIWQTVYAGRGGLAFAEGGGLLRTPFGNITSPPQGYIWDDARRANVSVRSYGEFVEHAVRTPSGDVVAVAAVPGLKDAVAPAYAGWDLEITDNKRADAWLDEFRRFERDGTLPQLSIIRLPNDHTSGTRPGARTPRAMVAENDLALGRIVETISNSAYWRDSAIFVVEDDAQSGPDHVDAHRSVLLVASPFAKRGFVDHTFYTTSGVLRTIELILGLQPMSQYDAAATPLYNAFLGSSDMNGYRRLEPRVPLDERNPGSAFGALASMQMDFSVEDRAPELLLNEIVWRSIRGPDSPMPPPRRSIFVSPASRAVDADDDDDEDDF